MADYREDYIPKQDVKVESNFTWEQVQAAVDKAVSKVKEEQLSDKSNGDVRSDYAKGYDRGFSEGYEFAKTEAIIAAVRVISNL